MLDGINHVFYHGTVYRRRTPPGPGGLYASTEYSPSNPWWQDFGAMNRYIERVQSVLQSGTPDNDILVYWPVFDLWDGSEGMMQQLQVHDVRWLTDDRPGGWRGRCRCGWRLRLHLRCAAVAHDDGRWPAGHARCALPGAPGSRCPAHAGGDARPHLRLAGEGATVVFESLPEDVPGFGTAPGRTSNTFCRVVGRIPFSSKDGAGNSAHSTR